jgi:hypothetical protein
MKKKLAKGREDGGLPDPSLLNTGVAPDPRTILEKSQDYQHTELASAFPVTWWEKPQTEWKKYSIRDQDGSSSCVAQSGAKAYEALMNTIASAHPTYRSRANFPAQGMWLANLGDIMRKQGTTDEALDVSQKLDESQMNRSITVDTPLKLPNYVKINPKDIEAIAQTIEQHKQVPIIFYGSISEWTNVPVFNSSAPQNLNHCVTAIDYFLYQGKKALLIDDSWGKATSIGNGGQRVITEDYLIARAGDAMYFLKDDSIPPIPVHTFTKKLYYGLKHDKEVEALQGILSYEGLFPADPTYHTGNMLQMTCHALKKWQVIHGLLDFQNENDMSKIVFGPKSIVVANKLYSTP